MMSHISKAMPYVTGALILAAILGLFDTWKLAREIPSLKSDIANVETHVESVENKVNDIKVELAKINTSLRHLLEPNKVSLNSKRASDSKTN